MTTTRPRGFVDWRPQSKTQPLIEGVADVLEEYEDYLPLTIRQVFYRLVAKMGFEKSEKGYARLCEILNRARRAKIISMDAIRDDGFHITRFNHYNDVDEVLLDFKLTAQFLNVDRQRYQGRRLAVWCEAQGMVPMLERVTLPYGIPVASSGGFDSLSTKYRMAKHFAEAEETEVLHIGDFDPSGVHMFSSLGEDIAAFIADLGSDVPFTRLAVTPEQIKQYDLPTAPPKKTDRRSFDSEDTVQCEALPPDVLSRILKDAIESRVDLGAYWDALNYEQQVRKEILEIINGKLT